jgi:hypothetical protein
MTLSIKYNDALHFLQIIMAFCLMILGSEHNGIFSITVLSRTIILYRVLTFCVVLSVVQPLEFKTA